MVKKKKKDKNMMSIAPNADAEDKETGKFNSLTKN